MNPVGKESGHRRRRVVAPAHLVSGRSRFAGERRHGTSIKGATDISDDRTRARRMTRLHGVAVPGIGPDSSGTRRRLGRLQLVGVRNHQWDVAEHHRQCAAHSGIYHGA
ncbi:Uncharacterised protein [Mycobacterium tuberculosis]|nr:Uncharacterised protein [Mycobacterium tuberculosis]